jgi:hypothetical protein
MDDLFEGRAKGGIAAAKKMSKQELRDRAKKGAVARWGIKAIYRGSFERDFGIDVDCYVLDDEQKTAVISQRGMGQALLLDGSGAALQRFMATKAMAEFISPEIRKSLENPIKFQWGIGGAGSPPPSVVYGFDATLLIDVCNAIVAANGAGKLRRPKVADQARIILTASAKSGIKNLVYAIAGYNPTAEEVINAFKFYVLEEAKKYEP